MCFRAPDYPLLVGKLQCASWQPTSSIFDCLVHPWEHFSFTFLEILRYPSTAPPPHQIEVVATWHRSECNGVPKALVVGASRRILAIRDNLSLFGHEIPNSWVSTQATVPGSGQHPVVEGSRMTMSVGTPDQFVGSLLSLKLGAPELLMMAVNINALLEPRSVAQRYCTMTTGAVKGRNTPFI